ncbi:MAG: peptide chain release factor 3 [Kiritimatiellia bacterium]
MTASADIADISSKHTIRREIARRRTFAIVSHPDAGKTTLTEKFLLYGGALHLAGSVKARKNQRATTSDWMELEKKRGISISSTVLQFDYNGFRINLLDTPGHKDFSEDTYRVLTAVDAAVMVIDAGKGIEAQTRKLFEVCRRRGVPIFTFMNKLDRPTLEPLALLDELESVLSIAAYPMNWPLGTGFDFKGVWDRQTKMAHLYERTVGGATRAPVFAAELHDRQVSEQMDETTHRTVCEEVAMLEAAGAQLHPADVLAGKTTPVYFGSALNNFGVQLLLDGFLELSAAPSGRRSRNGDLVQPEHPAFSGFVFKIQANMDPRHRDRIAFVRVVSGKFERDMNVTLARAKKTVRLSNAAKLFGRERETVDEAFPGDVVGIVGSAQFAIGDTLTEDPAIAYEEIPCFAPECFAYLENPEPANFKRFREGLEQLLQEGVVQSYQLDDQLHKTLLGAVGPLQLEIVQYRLESEYGAASRLEPAPWTVTRWIAPETALENLQLPTAARLARDRLERTVILFPDEWNLRYFQERNPAVRLSEIPF